MYKDLAWLPWNSILRSKKVSILLNWLIAIKNYGIKGAFV